MQMKRPYVATLDMEPAIEVREPDDGEDAEPVH